MKNKATISTDFFNVKKIKNTENLNFILKDETNNINTFNKVMKQYKDIGILFISNLDTILVHYLVMFCDYHRIPLYLMENPKHSILSVNKNSPIIKKVLNYLEKEAIYEVVDIYQQKI